MKKLFLFIALLLTTFLQGMSTAQAQTSTFSYTGSVQTYTVPSGVSGLAITAQGATGGYCSQEGITMSDRFGFGACVVCTLSVVSGSVVYVYAGGRGGNGVAIVGGEGARGWNGGGLGSIGYLPYVGGGGGGASDLRVGGTGLANRVVVAAGGGGAGGDYFLPRVDQERGGDGGTLTGEAGSYAGTVGHARAGGGGAPLTGGSAGIYGGWTSGSAGVLGIGGDAGGGGGGGGGGYYGGGGGSWGGGGGGSSYTDATLCSGVVHTRGCRTLGNGVVTITPLGCTPPAPGAIVGANNFCVGVTTPYTNPTGTGGGTWSSSDLTVSVGSSTGLVTGVSSGTAVISYYVTSPCGNALATKTITIDLSPGPITGPTRLCVGQTITLGNSVSGGGWTSRSPAVATIDTFTGSVFGVAAGNTVITYAIGPCITTTTITVNPNPAPVVGPRDGCKLTSITLTDATPGGTWTSSIVGVATVGSLTGIVTGVNAGFTNIIYTLPTGCTASKFVQIHEPPSRITGDSSICEGYYSPLANGIPGGVWSSSNIPVATVDPTGMCYGATPGLSFISYSIVGCPAAVFPLTVNPTPTPIGGLTSLCIGVATALTDATPGGAWTSSDTTVATISPTGVLTTISYIVGSTTIITYTMPTGCFTTIPVTVSGSPAPITGPDSVCQGARVTLDDVTPGGLWSSADLATAQVVDTSGVVLGVSAGAVTISYTLSTGCYAAMTFIVKPPTPAFVNVVTTPGDSVCAKTPLHFVASGINAGVPTFTWRKFFPGPILDTTPIFDYTPIHGDVLICEMICHGVCALHDTVYDTVRTNVYPNVSPNITIEHFRPTNSIEYLGQVFTFFSNVTYGGTSQTFQWYVNRVAVPGATGSTFAHAVYHNDTIYCIVHGNPPCDTLPSFDTSNKIVIYADFVGVNSIAAGGKTLNLYPNPNSGSFTLTGTIAATATKSVNLEVTNMLGQVVYTGTTMPLNGKIRAEISLDNLASGAYLLHATSENVNEVFHFAVSR